MWPSYATISTCQKVNLWFYTVNKWKDNVKHILDHMNELVCYGVDSGSHANIGASVGIVFSRIMLSYSRKKQSSFCHDNKTF